MIVLIERMGFFIVCTLILLYGLFLYGTNKHGRGALVFFFFLTGGFHFLKEEWCPIKYKDFALIYLFMVAFINVIKGNIAFFKPQTKIYKIAIIIGIYVTLEFIRTIILKEEVLKLALANYRTYLPFLSFWLVQELKSHEIKQLFRIITIITILSIVLYDIQPLINTKILQHERIDLNNEARYRNIPYLAYFFLLFYTIKLNIKKPTTYALTLLFVVAIVLTQHRGVMLSYIMCICVYLIISKKGKLLVQYGVIGLIIFFFMGNAILERFNTKGNDRFNTWSDIKNVVNLDYQNAINSEYENEGGTLSFRVLLLMERINYMSKQTSKLLFGLGTRHEDSPYTKKHFDFNIGTHNQKTDTIGQISSSDLVWVDPLIRFGVIGIILLLTLSWLTLKFLYKERNCSDVAMGAFLFYLFLILISFKNNHLYGNLQLFFIYILIEYIRNNQYEIEFQKKV